MKKEFIEYWNSKKEYIEKDLWVIRNFLLEEEIEYLKLRASEKEGWYTTMRSPYGNIRNKWIDQVPKYDENNNLIMPSNEKPSIDVPFFNEEEGIFQRLHAVLPKTYRQHNTLQSFFSVTDEELKKIKLNTSDKDLPAMDWHADGMNSSPTKMTGAFTIYINDDFEGGILEFKNKEYKIRPESGMLINIPITEEFTHRVTRVTKGDRHTLYGNCWEDSNLAPISTTENC